VTSDRVTRSTPVEKQTSADRVEGIARVARGGGATLVGAAVTALCTFALTVVVARGLSRPDAGVFFSVTSLFLVATTIGQLGTQTGVVYFVARSRTHRRTDLIGRYMRAAMRPVLVLALAMGVAMFFLAHPLARITSPGHVDQATAYLRVLALFVPVAGIETVFLAGTRGMGSMRPNTTIEQIGRPLVQLALVAGVVYTSSAVLCGLAWGIAYVPAAILAWAAWGRMYRKRDTRRDARRDGQHGTPVASVNREFWRFTMPRSLTSVIQMLMQRFDIVLVGALAGATDAAVYAAATRFVVLGQLGVNALTIAAQPLFAQRLATKDHGGANELYRVSTAWLVLVTWPIYLTLIVFAKPVLRVFGHGYGAGETVVVLLALSMLVATGLGMVDTVLAMAGHTAWNLVNAVLALAVNLGLDFWLIPSHGVLGAAIGWACAILVRNVAAAAMVAFELRFVPFSKGVGIAISITTGSFFVLSGLVRIVVGPTLPGLVIALIVATPSFLVIAWRLRSVLHLDLLSQARSGSLRRSGVG